MDGPSDARGIGLPIGLIVKNEDSCVKAVLQQSGNEPQPATKKKETVRRRTGADVSFCRCVSDRVFFLNPDFFAAAGT